MSSALSVILTRRRGTSQEDMMRPFAAAQGRGGVSWYDNLAGVSLEGPRKVHFKILHLNLKLF